MNLQDQLVSLELSKKLYELGIKFIDNYEKGYGVDALGNVYTFKQGRFREISSHYNKGYKRVFLFKNNKKSNHSIHRLVAGAFIPRVPGKNYVNHKDGNRRNNEARNLEWCTREENQKHSREVLGNTGRGNKNANYGYRKSRFYPSESLRSKLIEAGVPRYKHDIVSLGEMLPPLIVSYRRGGRGKEKVDTGYSCTSWGKISAPKQHADTEADSRAKMLLHLISSGVIEAP